MGLSKALLWLCIMTFALLRSRSARGSRTALEFPEAPASQRENTIDLAQSQSSRRGWDYPKAFDWLCTMSFALLGLRFGRGSRTAFESPEARFLERENTTNLAQSRSWRRGWDSNPRELSLCRFSRPEPSTTRPPLLRVKTGGMFHSADFGQGRRVTSAQAFRGAHSSRVLAMTSRHRELHQDCCGEIPQPALETSALPRHGRRRTRRR